ncbi:unnamed protein product [Ceutorhynchus assimilis]|uniref:Uncharacterized protein n=1 Tax=Ceutorhynchus assimilis TaxID=467358 RepID=A0A9N9MM89_9CUCU|nr:unnamed protein product [Ceutorhynchus assimilis]
MKNLSDEDYALHEIKKNEEREAKNKDKASENRVFCMDMQAVLLSPKSNTSALYFKMNLMVHNFTIFDMKLNKGYCFVWLEASGGVSPDNYSSIICSFIIDNVLVLKPNQNIILYSDGCAAQIRNVTLSNALLNSSIQYKITIEQKYLERGHAHMKAAHMHSLIERKLQNTNIDVPADYVSVFLQLVPLVIALSGHQASKQSRNLQKTCRGLQKNLDQTSERSVFKAQNDSDW